MNTQQRIMKSQPSKYLLVTACLLTLVTGASGATPGSNDAATPPFITGAFDPYRVIHLIYAGRTDSALSVIDDFERETPSDPFVLLIKAKVLRERLNDEDNDKDNIRRGTEPIHAVIDRAIEMCDDALDRRDPEPRFHFYRGYGWLGKAQLYVLTRSYWSAGRAASRGKSDLEHYLEAYPGDPDAEGMLGAYLYFADAIPGLIKIFAKLLFIPGGDRDRGLEMLSYGATHPGLFTEDYKTILAAVDLVFEGKFEAGTSRFISLLDEYPHYTRLAEPISVVVPFNPLDRQRLGEIQARAIENYFSLENPSRDWSIVQRVRLSRAFSELYFGSPLDAIEIFADLLQSPPDHPDWFLPIALLNRGYFLQKTGERAQALAAYEKVRSSKDMSYYHGVADMMLESLNGSVKTVRLDDLNFIKEIYEGHIDEAEIGLRSYGREYGNDAMFYFYAGDIEVFKQNFPEARQAYERALDTTESGGDQIYQMFSAIRLAELVGMDGDFGKAREHLEHAKNYCHANYLLDFMIRSRNRYYQLLDEGTIDFRPAILIRRRADGGHPSSSPGR